VLSGISGVLKLFLLDKLTYKWYIKTMIKINVFKCKCKRCGHSWIPRTEDVRRCPHCKSYYWDRKRKMKNERSTAKLLPKGKNQRV